MPRSPLSVEERFWSSVDKSGDCWEWTRGRGGTGYGVLSVQGKKTGAHRVGYELQHGPIPSGMFVCHSCDNRKCVRGDHLFLGTHADNMRDMHTKGRWRSWHTEKTHCYAGHEFTPENTYIAKNGKDSNRTFRWCRQCRIDRRNQARKEGRKVL